MSSEAITADSGLLEAQPSRFKQILSWIGWFYFGLFFLVVFTLMKLPEERINRFIQGTLANQLQPRGISLVAGHSHLSIGLGVSYVMSDVTIHLPAPQAPAHLDVVSVSPALIPLLTGRLGGSVDVRNGSGRFTANFAARGKSFSGSFNAKSLDLGKMGILPMAAGIQGGAIVSGSGTFSLDTSNFATTVLDLDVNLSHIVLDQQSIMGIAIPKISVSEGTITAATEKGRLAIKKFQLGKAGPGASNDDVRATLTGDVTLGRNLDMSMVNVKALFSLSQTILQNQSLSLLPMLLQQGKQADGSYSYRITGPVANMVSTPEPPGAR